MADRLVAGTAVMFGITASPAIAEVCDKVRPTWSRADGPVDAISELGYVLLSPSGAILATLILLALWRKRWWLWAIVVAFAILRLWLYLPDDGIEAFAVREGCVGPRYLALSAMASIVLWTFIMMVRRPAA